MFRSMLLAALSSLTLLAQVDPKLQACATDVLDIYGGTATSTKPEIITLIDRSGSTAGLSWDARYYTNTQVNWHLKAARKVGYGNPLFGYYDDAGSDANSDGDRCYLRVVSSSTYTGIKFTVNLVVQVRDSSGDYNWVDRLTEGLLIKPNGNPVVDTDVSDPSDKNLWAQQASHVRFAVTSKPFSDAPKYRYGTTDYAIPTENCEIQARPFSTGSDGNYSDSSLGDIATSTKTRVIDIPLAWAVFDRVPNSESGANHKNHKGVLTTITGAHEYLHLNEAIDKKHPQHLYMYDPAWDTTANPPTEGNGKQWYEVDTLWWEKPGQGGWSGIILDSEDYFKGFDLTPDYLAWAFFGQDIRNPSEAGAYKSKMVDQYNGDNDGDYTVADVREGGAGYLIHTRDLISWTGNGLPQMTRFQAIKYAIIKTWIEQQDQVWWAIRFLNYCDSGGGFQENGRTSATDSFNSSNLTGNPGDRMLLRLAKPTANTPAVELQYIQHMGSEGATPLTFGLLNTYAQMASTDNGANGSVFNAMKTESPIRTCRKSFVVVLSDGNPNDNDENGRGCAGANGQALGTGDYWAAGGTNILATGPAANTFAPTKTNFNIWSLAAMTAHLSFSSLTGAPSDDDNANVKMPFRVTSRPTGTTRRISTMTIGVSMAGRLSDTDGAKAAMYRTALYGWEKRTSFSADPLPLPYDENIAGRNDKDKNPYFFDAQSPEGIAQALKAAFDAARSVTNTMGAPVAPLLGLGVGNQMYFGTFTSGETGQAVWKGDLLMTGLKVVGNSTSLIGRDGNEVLDTVSPTNSIWAASGMLTVKGWKDRTLYTLTPDSSSPGKFLKTLLAWDENTSKTTLPNSALGVSSDAERYSLIRFMMGANKEAQEDTSNPTSKIGTRDDIMGAIVNSTPAILNFPISMAPSTTLLNKLDIEHPGLTDKRFRLIIVGDNQGILHGFGEVAGLDSGGVLRAAVDELWGIIPPDILKGLQAWRTGTKFRYLVDGSPTVYLNEKGTANGLIDGTGTNADVVRVMFGLRKGGRSYYALSFTDNNPTKPYVAWMLRPDDSTDSVVSKMGFSTCTPNAARIQDGTILKDAFFIGGGLSTAEVDTKFGFKLGRSILAVRALEDASGNPVIIKSWDYSEDATDKGSIPASVIPMEVVLKSNKAQRLYFGTAFGHVYALGAKATSGLRTDTANINDWQLRTIFRSKYTNQSMGSSPTIFNVPYGYPVERDTDPKPMVPAVGVAFGLGDRNDPMDSDSRDPGGDSPVFANRFIMILDRQDSADLKVGTNAVDTFGYNEDYLADLTAVASSTAASITPSNASYYLRTKSGYKLEYATRTQKPDSSTAYYYQKTVTTPIVLNKALFFTKFAPKVTSGECGGAGGTSYVYRMCDVFNPIYANGTVSSTSTLCSGIAATFNDIPSEPGGVGLSAIVVVGEIQNPEGLGGSGTVDPKSIPSNPITSLTRPRAWRIVR